MEDEGTLVFSSSCHCRGEAGLVTPRGETEVEDWESDRDLGLWGNIVELKGCRFLIATAPQVSSVHE